MSLEPRWQWQGLPRAQPNHRQLLLWRVTCPSPVARAETQKSISPAIPGSHTDHSCPSGLQEPGSQGNSQTPAGTGSNLHGDRAPGPQSCQGRRSLSVESPNQKAPERPGNLCFSFLLSSALLMKLTSLWDTRHIFYTSLLFPPPHLGARTGLRLTPSSSPELYLDLGAFVL